MLYKNNLNHEEYDEIRKKYSVIKQSNGYGIRIEKQKQYHDTKQKKNDTNKITEHNKEHLNDSMKMSGIA